MTGTTAPKRHFLDHWPIWAGLAVLAAIGLAQVSILRGEHANALWMIVASVSLYLIAYRYYSLFIARRVMRLEDSRPMPAHRFSYRLDYVPTTKYILFGHHLAAIAGADPLRRRRRAGLFGNFFPFLFITIACGAVSGFHALISSGATPKLIDNEGHARFIGYGGMLMESFVAMMALVAASIIDPGMCFTMNSPAAIIGTTPNFAAAQVTEWGLPITAETITQPAADVGETMIISRAGGAPTLAVGMAQIFSHVIGGKAMMAFWRHFAILFEAPFLLTAVDAGTRAGRFMSQDLMGVFVPAMRKTSSPGGNLVATGLCVAPWGFFLHRGGTDPLGGVNTLWPLFGIANQMLAAIALMLKSLGQVSPGLDIPLARLLPGGLLVIGRR